MRGGICASALCVRQSRKFRENRGAYERGARFSKKFAYRSFLADSVGFIPEPTAEHSFYLLAYLKPRTSNFIHSFL